MTDPGNFGSEQIDRDIAFSQTVAEASLNQAGRLAKSDPARSQLAYLTAATKFRRAAAQLLLTENFRNAPETLRQAAGCYAAAGVKYGAFLYHLAGIRENIAEILVFSLANPLARDREQGSRWADSTGQRLQEIYPLLVTGAYLEWPDRYAPTWEIGRFAEEQRYIALAVYADLLALKGYKIGVLGLDVSFYLDVFEYFLGPWPYGLYPELTLAQIMRPFLCNYEHALQLSKTVAHNWKRLSMPFHPAEIDILALLELIRVREPEDFSVELARAPISAEAKENISEFLQRISQR